MTATHDPAADTMTLTNGAGSTTVPASGTILGSFEYVSNADTTIARGTTQGGAGQVLILFADTVPMRGTTDYLELGGFVSN